MTRLFNLVSGALLLAALVGFFSARAIPVEVKQETRPLSWEHEGRFDYLIHLKPSYLYGPEPVAPPPPPENAVFPAEIISSVDMSFRFQPAAGGIARVGISAVLSSADVWQKTITLVPAADRYAPFTTEFPLDLAAIVALYDQIDAETMLNTYNRSVKIVATVKMGTVTFVQELPVFMREHLLEFGGELVRRQDGAIGSFDYVIHLAENSLYSTETLRAPAAASYTAPESTAILRPGQTVFTGLIDSMEASFSYRFSSDRPAGKVVSTVQLAAQLQATGAESVEIWSKTFPILAAEKGGDFTVSFPVDVAGFLGLLDQIRRETSAAAEATNLTLNAVVHTVAETTAGTVDETFTHSLRADIKGATLEWSKDMSRSQPNAITTSQLVPNPGKYLGMSVGGARSLSTAAVAVFGFIFLSALAWYFLLRPAPRPAFEQEAARARRRYGERMAEAVANTPAWGEKVIGVASLADLVKIADELGKPLIHLRPGRPGEPHAYYVLDATTRYQYVTNTNKEGV